MNRLMGTVSLVTLLLVSGSWPKAWADDLNSSLNQFYTQLRNNPHLSTSSPEEIKAEVQKADEQTVQPAQRRLAQTQAQHSKEQQEARLRQMGNISGGPGTVEQSNG